MISSGIKRGVAATAISALAVAGFPLLATSATAAPGDNFTVTFTGPALNGGTEGAVVVIRAENGEITPGAIKAVGTSGNTTGTEDNADQNVEVVSASSDGADSGGTGFELIEVRVAVTTSTTGDTATFRLFEDDSPSNNTLDASEARQPVSISTAGPLASVEITPASQTTPQGIESGAYTVTIRDSAGRTTQLAPATNLTITDEAPVEVTETGPDTAAANDDSITSQEIARGTDTFTADPNGAAVGEYDITINQGPITDTATLVVTEAANLDEDEIDIVTAADSWNGFGDGTDGGTTSVRVDQNTIRFDFNSDPNQPGANVQQTVNGFGGVTFGGQDMATYNTTLDANGNGSITVTADAATIQEGDGFTTSINGFDQTIVFERAAADDIDGEQATYFCQDDAACTVTAVVTDQFGNPVTTGEVEASRNGQNNDTTPQRKPVGADGTVDFTFTDTNPVDGGTDVVTFEYFVDQFDNTADESDNSTTIRYSATGQGGNYVVSLDGENTEGANYDAGDAAIIPLVDTVADEFVNPDDEDATIAITGGEPNQAVTLSVNNGALILAPGENNLAQGSASQNATLNGAGTLPAGYRIIGTTSGLVTLTVDSANRTETAQLTVLAQDDPASARNVTLTSPATVPNGTDQITFVAVVTDAFGNPVPGVPNGTFNKQVTGPGQYQDGDAQTDANGVLNLNVNVDDDAEGDVTLTIDAADTFGQFGADKDRQTSASATNDGEGLTASSDVASSTTTVEAGNDGPIRERITAVLEGRNTGAKTDKLKVITEPRRVADGARVNLFRINKNGVRELVESAELNANGIKRFQVPDVNGKKKTKYVARIKKTDDSKAVKNTNTKRVR